MNKKLVEFLFVGLIIALILFMIWMVFWLKSESKDCVANPIKYFHEKNPHITCSCYKDGVLVEGLGDEEIVYDLKP